MSSVLCVGHAVQDLVFTVPALPDRGEKYRATRFETVGGGPAATAAVAIARLGVRPVLAARVGDDAAAGMIVAELTACGVDCAHVRRCTGCASSVSAVIVDVRGERMIVNQHRGLRARPARRGDAQARYCGERLGNATPLLAGNLIGTDYGDRAADLLDWSRHARRGHNHRVRGDVGGDR